MDTLNTVLTKRANKAFRKAEAATTLNDYRFWRAQHLEAIEALKALPNTGGDPIKALYQY